jgi:hypothetical protein
MGGAQAARAAGYSVHGAKVAAAKLERRDDVRAAISEARASETVGTPERSPEFASAEAYLAAVVAGTTVPDPVRVSAARALIQYQAPRQRRPLPAPLSPTQAAHRDASAAEREHRDDWARKVVEIRSRLGRKGD